MRVIFHSVGIGIILYVSYRTLESFASEIQGRYYYEIDGTCFERYSSSVCLRNIT